MKKKITVLLIVLGSLQPGIIGASTKKQDQADPTEFSQQMLESLLIEMNFKYPHIVYAQAVLESGNFTSKSFVEEHNMFGMKRARGRITTALASPNSYAIYSSWKSSLIDYGFYQSRFIHKIKSEQEYYDYLERSYASDPEYVEKLKNIVRVGKLVEKFSKK